MAQRGGLILEKSRKNALEEIERWSKEIKRGAASLAIVAILDEQTAYGYEIVKTLGERASFLQLEQGTVYPLLRRLEKRKLLESEWNYDDPKKPKKYYKLTADGKMALQMMTETWSVLSDELRRLLEGADSQ
ncbi:MAG: PadR family transcriptional regulator [Candidatus Thorarchaeota archaeon]|nr:MAG: PadR family transcriptional regulator [Candidatus Thorarchaeota archaeon]